MRLLCSIAAAAVVLPAPALPAPGQHPGPAAFYAGAAKVEITPGPEARAPLAGYWNRFMKRARGARDPLFCRALVLRGGGDAAIVSCDLLSISGSLRRKVLGRIKDTPYNDENLLLAASHTHSGPSGYENNQVFEAFFGGYNEELTEQLAQKIELAIKRAEDNMAPARAEVSEARLEGVVINRREPSAGYDYLDRRAAGEASGLTNPVLTTIRIKRKDGPTAAVIFHFAAHATILGADNMSFSADWPGAAAATIEADLPGAVALYLNGAEGDQTILVPQDDNEDYEWVRRTGETIGRACLDSMEQAAAFEPLPVAARITRRSVPGWATIMGLPFPERAVSRLFPAMTLQVVRMGEAAFMAVPLEMTAGPGLALESSSRSPEVARPLVVGLANDYYWYCAGPEDFGAGGYEVENTIFGKKEAGLVIGEELMLLKVLLQDGPAATAQRGAAK